MDETWEQEEESFDAMERHWPVRPLLLAALGAVAGLAFHLILGPDLPRDLPAIRMAALGFVVVTAGLIGFTLERRRWPLSLAFSLVCGGIAAAILYWNGDTGAWSATQHWRVVSLALALAIATPLLQASRDEGAFRFPYAQVHDHVWINAVLWCACWAFVGISVLLLVLLGALFGLIGIDFLTSLLRDSWFDRELVGLTFGAAIGLFREHDQVLRMAQRVVSTVLAVLAPVLAVGLLMFLLALPFTGLNALWDATKATTPILLACAIGALVLANTVIGSAPDHEPRALPLRLGAMGLGLVVLPLAVLAAVATGLRIDQHGFTPDRLWALAFVTIACIFGVAYLLDLLIGRWEWGRRVRRANLALAFLTAAVALLLATPLLNFEQISTDDQVARLESGRVPPDKFDWAALAFDFGTAGKDAVRRLKSSKDKAIVRYAAKAAAAPSRWSLVDDRWARERRAKAKLDIRVLPVGHVLPDALREKIVDTQACTGTNCTVFMFAADKEAMLLTQSCFNAPEPQAAVAPGPASQSASRLLYAETERHYCDYPRHYRLTEAGWDEPGDLQERSAAEAATAAVGYREGKMEVRTVSRRQVFVGGMPVGDPFE